MSLSASFAASSAAPCEPTRPIGGAPSAACSRGGIGLRRAARRLLGTVLAAIPLGLGFLGVLTREGRTGFHDRFAGTEVAYVKDDARAPWAGAR